MTTKPTNPESFTFRAEIKELLGILAHSLYTEREIFLRELISNSSDALNRVQYLKLSGEEVVDPDAELAVHVYCDPAERTLMVKDTGVGMTHAELVENLGTIAHSGARSFLASLAEGKGPSEIIGQFGVGFYSVFMVADEVRVTSRSYQPDGGAWTWISRGEDHYEVVPSDRSERGTTVWLKLKEDAAEFAEARRVEGIIHRHSDFVGYPIFLDGRVVNRQTALWRQSPAEVTEDVYNAFYRELSLDAEAPLARIHLTTDVPVQLYALLFVPADAQQQAFARREDFGLHLYVRKVLIQAHSKELLPPYLRFVEGVVDSEDLPLNVSRELVQSSQVVQRIRGVLGKKVLDRLGELAENDPARYDRFWEQFGPYLKEGVLTEPSARDKLLPLLRFRSSGVGADDWTTLADYVSRLPEGQSDIYYVVADDVTSAAASPHLEAFRARGLEVLYLVDTLDGLMMPGLAEFDGKALRNVDDPSIELPETAASAETTAAAAVAGADLDALVARFRAVLAEQASDVRPTDRLTDSPIRLVAPDDSWDHEMDRFRRVMERDWAVPPRVVELNPHHPVIRDLARLVAAGERADTVDAAITQLYENALLLEGLHPNPGHMVGRIQALIAAAVAVDRPPATPPKRRKKPGAEAAE
jgi:molecular chaperone HtpG